ncbi:MAG: cytochrome c biogenesis protein CcsA [Saprospiraceae bacterium]|nr:cytochrome c biogenesis protein CcsA [Saprospiraceae bacterium]
MDSIQYIGEHLLPGKIGHFAIILAFVSALFSAYSYFQSNKQSELENSWRSFGRVGFLVHGLSILTILGTIFYVMVNHYYEYHYVWSHVNEDLPFQFIFSAFWEGQEGSFLLWMFWHVVLGGILIFTAKKWESPVLGTLSLVQVFLMSMILGIYIGFGDDPMRFGSNPMVLLRDVMQAPIFNNADYLTLIEGNGLNPLLQNYWMTIHPPTLFLGFASTVVPFCFAVAGLLKKEPTAWLKPVLPWALFSAAILGTGILMGGAWAYEALSFGGYWAWDPVENMSLVPWLVLLGGVHTNLIARSTDHSVKATYLFYALTFILILYSTFMTRSGILGDTSVHAFTEMGLEWQLIGFMAFFSFFAIVPFVRQYKTIPGPKDEEKVASREFWMFLGSLILLFSAVMITASTSLPVFNKIMTAIDPLYEGKTINEPITHYNNYQLWIGVFIGLMSGFTQYLRWKELNWQKRARKIVVRIGIASAITIFLCWLVSLWIELYSWRYVVLLFSGLFTLVCNLDHLIFFAKANIRTAASTLSHVGFGILIVGVLASGLNKYHISSNPFAQQGLIETDRLDRNIMLFEGLPMYMSGFRVTYLGDEFEGNNRHYNIYFEELNENAEVVDTFTVHPNALYDNRVTKVAAYNPDTKHRLTKDIFTHIASIPLREADAEAARAEEDSLKFRSFSFLPEEGRILIDTFFGGDSAIVRDYNMKFGGWEYNKTEADGYTPEPGDITIGAKILIEDPRKDTTYVAEPMLLLRGSLLYTFPIQVQQIAMKIRLGESAMNRMFVAEEDLDYQPFKLRIGDQGTVEDLDFEFAGFNTAPNHPEYVAKEGDIAVGGKFLVKQAGVVVDSLEPMYLIRENRPYNLKATAAKSGLHIRFTALDPATESIEIFAAKSEIDPIVPVEIAKSPRTDFLILESIVFPGMNLVWSGSIIMLGGLLLGSFNRFRK